MTDQNDIIIDDEHDNDFDDSVIDFGKEHQEEESYSKKVQKRIDKLVYERNVERKQREELEERLAALEAKTTEREQSVINDELNQKLADLKAKKIDLLDSGEYQDAVDLDDEIIEIKLKQREKPQEQERQQSRQQSSAAEMPEAQQIWLSENDWYYSPMKAEKAKQANELYLSLVSEGYDPASEDTYRELDSRINGQKRTHRTAAPPTNAPERASGAASGQMKFTQQDAETMRRWNLDHNDPAARKAYLTEKARIEND